jgi:hypothetical protein
MTQHGQTAVKVNALVDEGIADLVSALSEIRGLMTIESCQGDLGGSDAFVIFRFGDWRQSGEFLFERLLPAMSPDLRSAVSLRLQAYDADTAVGSMTVDPSAVPALARCVRELLLPVGTGVLVTRDAHRKTIPKIVAATGSEGVPVMGVPSVGK